jgi:hypothetical protein
VVSTTLIVSVAVVSLLGFFLMQQIAAKLLDSANVQAYNQASQGLISAEVYPASLKPPGPSSQDLLSNVVTALASGQGPGAAYGVAITVRPNVLGYWAAAASRLDYHAP